MKGKEGESCKGWEEGGSRAIRDGSDAQYTISFESCSSSMACDIERMSSECSKKMKDMDETTSKASWTAVTQGKEKEKVVESGAVE